MFSSVLVMKNISKLNINLNIIKRVAAVASLAILASIFSPAAHSCTSAIMGPEASASGRPLLWKYRDTSTTYNKVEYVTAGEDGAYAYVALFNAKDKYLKEAWTGTNEVGFALMNTASYNLKDDKVPSKEMDKEGLVMTIALRTCQTGDDFRNF